VNADATREMVAVIPVRGGGLPAGALEAIAECGGVTVLAGSDPDTAGIVDVACTVGMLELGSFEPARWAAELEPHVADHFVVVLPGSPDGRDLAPRLAHRLGRPLLAGATSVSTTLATLSRNGGRSLLDVPIDEPVIATLQPGVRGVSPSPRPIDVWTIDPPCSPTPGPAATIEPHLMAELPADVTTMDLSEATRIVAGGAGLDGPGRFEQIAQLAAALGASIGATRVVTDRGWVGHERQIGTTGVVVDPELYVALGISGAVQHTAGLGAPDHIVSVNVDAFCPMMRQADLAVVTDANAVLDELARLLRSPATQAATDRSLAGARSLASDETS
jgi:electron transfer flavoprotein alpha subunit